jgi:hypothetical protein
MAFLALCTNKLTSPVSSSPSPSDPINSVSNVSYDSHGGRKGLGKLSMDVAVEATNWNLVDVRLGDMEADVYVDIEGTLIPHFSFLLN